jgi:hypothetical protein
VIEAILADIAFSGRSFAIRIAEHEHSAAQDSPRERCRAHNVHAFVIVQVG